MLLSLDRDKRLLCNLSINGSLFFSFMMVYIMLALGGNGFKAQFKYLTAACFKWRGERRQTRALISGLASGDPTPRCLSWFLCEVLGLFLCSLISWQLCPPKARWHPSEGRYQQYHGERLGLHPQHVIQNRNVNVRGRESQEFLLFPMITTLMPLTYNYLQFF